MYGLVDDQGIARPTAFRPPLYPWLLSIVSDSDQIHRSSVLVLHALLGGWTVLATFLISQRYVSIRMSFLAAALVGPDPILLMQSTLVMTETLATALPASVLGWCVRKQGRCSRQSEDNDSSTSVVQNVTWSIVLGLLLTLSYLCRPTFLA